MPDADRPPFLAALAFLLAVGWWATSLLAGSTALPERAARSGGAALWLLGVVALVGLLVARGRWSQRLAAALVLGLVAAVPFFDSSWTLWVGVGCAAAAGGLLLAPTATAWIRPGRSMDAPPDAAVVLMLLLLAWPLLGTPLVAGGTAWALVLWVGPLLAFWYGRAQVPALWAARGLSATLPLLAAVGAPWWGWALGVAVAGSTSWWAWQEGTRLAVLPLVSRPSSGVCPTPDFDTVLKGR